MSNHDSYSDSLVALYCRSSDSQHNPRLRIGAGHSIVTIKGVKEKHFCRGRRFSCRPAHPVEIVEENASLCYPSAKI